jgi:hypothetical protein
MVNAVMIYPLLAPARRAFANEDGLVKDFLLRFGVLRRIDAFIKSRRECFAAVLAITVNPFLFPT